jgi:hypothetical protein
MGWQIEVSPVVKRRDTSLQCRDGAGLASPAEVLLYGNAGIRKDLGASSRSTGLPQLNGLESILFSHVPR